MPKKDTCAVPRRARAAATMPGSRPSRAAMLSALERPGMPHIRRYVGASRASSNSTLAFSNRGSWYFSDVSDLRPQKGIYLGFWVPLGLLSVFNRRKCGAPVDAPHQAERGRQPRLVELHARVLEPRILVLQRRQRPARAWAWGTPRDVSVLQPSVGKKASNMCKHLAGSEGPSPGRAVRQATPTFCNNAEVSLQTKVRAAPMVGALE